MNKPYYGIWFDTYEGKRMDRWIWHKRIDEANMEFETENLDEAISVMRDFQDRNPKAVYSVRARN